MSVPSGLNLTTRAQFERELVDEKVWAIIASTCFPIHSQEELTQTRTTVNQGATDDLNRVLSSASGPYNGTSAVTVYINEARSSNAV